MINSSKVVIGHKEEENTTNGNMSSYIEDASNFFRDHNSCCSGDGDKNPAAAVTAMAISRRRRGLCHSSWFMALPSSAAVSPTQIEQLRPKEELVGALETSIARRYSDVDRFLAGS